jgi:hypothetical protein
MKQVTAPVQKWTIRRIYESVPENELQELEASGQAVDNVQWYWGRIASEWISRGMPKMLVYAAIGKKVGRSAVTIAQCFYTYTTFTRTEMLYDERIPYSVYNHARQWSAPDEVLEYYITHACSVDEIEQVFRGSEPDDEREAFGKTSLPRFLVGAWREARGLPPEKYDRAMLLLREYLEVIGWDKDE